MMQYSLEKKRTVREREVVEGNIRMFNKLQDVNRNKESISILD